MSRWAVSERLEPPRRAAGLNFCVTLGGSAILAPVPWLSLLQNVKEQGRGRATLLHTTMY
jgi:hypothetical protein